MEGLKKINWKAADSVLTLPNVRLHPSLRAAENADMHPNPRREGWALVSATVADRALNSKCGLAISGTEISEARVA